MKRCPTCNRTYPDEQTFCMEDGTTLIESAATASDPGATVAFTEQPGSTPPPTGTQSAGTNAAPGYQPPPPPGMFQPPPGGGATGEAAGKFQPALMGGVVLGVLAIVTSLIPVPMATWCCCLWGILGGVLAVYLYVKRSPVPVRSGDGAMLGLLAGGIGALIYILVAFPLTYFTVDPDLVQAQIEERMRGQGQSFDIRPYWGLFLFLIMFIFGIGLTALSLIGGLIGVPIFEKREARATAPPPPPQSF
ncbi:MAG: hypothetical protein ICV68_03890 [Pyrinomonadaceae bacterium]|nr:hypothetical protein [Pyrinomonadaceae bacterium]